MNLVSSQYRNVSVADVPVALEEPELRSYLLGRPVYRRTRYLVVQRGGAAALLEVTKESEQPLFSPVTSVTMLAGGEETALVDAPGADTAVPTQLARVAARQAPGKRCVIVRGRYGHVNFILDPAPVRIRVVEVVPPRPPKLVDQLNRVLDLAEDLPPVELIPELVDLAELVSSAGGDGTADGPEAGAGAAAGPVPAGGYLFPCRAGEGEQGWARVPVPVRFLDELPEREPWTLVGCARSKSIHDWFYGGDVPMIDMCPRNLAGRLHTAGGPAGGPAGGAAGIRHPAGGMTGGVITKCCLLEDRVAAGDGMVVVPWGATAAQIRDGLRLAVAAAGRAQR